MSSSLVALLAGPAVRVQPGLPISRAARRSRARSSSIRIAQLTRRLAARQSARARTSRGADSPTASSTRTRSSRAYRRLGYVVAGVSELSAHRHAGRHGHACRSTSTATTSASAISWRSAPRVVVVRLSARAGAQPRSSSSSITSAPRPISSRSPIPKCATAIRSRTLQRLTGYQLIEVVNGPVRRRRTMGLRRSQRPAVWGSPTTTITT